MKKNLKKILIFPFILCTAAHGSLLWGIQGGIDKFQKNDFKGAKNYFLNYVSNNPEDEDGWWYLAQSCSKLQDKNAKQYFKKSYEKMLKEKNLEKITFEGENDENLEDYFDMAAMYFENGNTKEADFYADLMLKINPKSASALFIKSKIAQLKGDKEAAKDFLNRAVILNNELLKTNLAKSLGITSPPEISKEMYNLFALEAYFSGKTDDAEKYFKKYLEIEKNAEIYNFLADCYLKKGDLDSARKTIDESLKLFENNPQSYLLEAKIYDLKNEKEKQKNSLLKALEINPNNPKTLLALGNFYLETKDCKNAEKHFETLINVDDSLWEAYCGYIFALTEEGKLKKAISLTRKASALNKNADEIYFLLAKICENQASYEEALEYLTQALEKAENPCYFLESAKINYYLKNYEKSLEFLKKASEISFEKEQKKEINEYFIKNYLKTGDLENAKKYTEEKLLLDKNSIMYKYNLYVLHKLQGDEIKSRSEFAQIKKFKPEKPEDYILLSEIDFEEKGLEAAIKTLDNTIKKFPDSYRLYAEKMKLYFISGNPEKLQETIEKSQRIFN